MEPESETKCRCCGATSPLRELFGPGPMGRAFSGLWCPFCRVYRWQDPGAHIVAWGAVWLSYAAWAPSRASFFQGLLLIAIFWIPVRIATILLHELAHLIAAALLGYRTWGLTLGTGEVKRRLRLGRWHVEFTSNWAGGNGHALLAPVPGAVSLTRERIVLLAPYVAHVSVAVFAWPRSGQPWPGLGWFIVAMQLWYCVWNLWPRLRDSDVSVTDGMALERIRVRPAWVLQRSAWAAARVDAQLALLGGTVEDAERVLEAVGSDGKGTPEYAAIEFMIRWPDRAREPQRETLAAYERLTESLPELSRMDRFAIGEPPGEDAVDSLLAAWLYQADQPDRLIAMLEKKLETSQPPVERAYWGALYAVAVLLIEADPPERVLALAAEASAALPWYDIAVVAAALADLVRNDSKTALLRVENATAYQRPDSALSIRDGVCALALARQGQRHRARALWDDLREYHPGPILTRRVGLELGLTKGESEISGADR